MKKYYRLLPLLPVCFFLMLNFFSVSTAQAAADSVSTKTYNELTEIQELMAEDDMAGAVSRLNELLENVEEDTLDQALTLQTMGYVEMSQENFPSAIDYLKRSLDTGRLPQQVVYNVGYMVAQLHAALGEFDQALTFAEEWFKQLLEPTPDQMMFMANIYAQTERYSESIPYAERAVSTAENPRESWYQLLTADYFELERFPEAGDSLLRMVGLWPEKASYWEQLASVYVVMEQEDHALATLAIAFDEGVLEKESTVKSMIQLAVMQGVPDRGARMLKAAIEAGLVPEEEEYLEMLAQAWVNAREFEEAISSYERMASLVETGDPWMKIANIHVEATRWNEAEEAVLKALDTDLEEAGKAWLLLGIASAEQGKFTESREALRKARAFEDTERSASSWLRYAEDMKRQADWLAENR